MGDPEKAGLRLRAPARMRDASLPPRSLQVLGTLSLGRLGGWTPTP